MALARALPAHGAGDDENGTYIFGLTGGVRGSVFCSCHTLWVSSFPMGASYVYRTVRVRLADMSDAAKLRVWQLRSEQGQAFNLGVELALASSEKDSKVLSSYDAFKELTVRRRAGVMPTDVTVELQRGGVSAGVDAVTKWQEDGTSACGVG